jgi:UDP-glucose 4-epimerase
MKVLITDGFGYLGGRIAIHLGGVYPKKDIRILSKAEGQKIPVWANGFDVTTGDFFNENSIKEACEGIDAIVHFAAMNEIESGKDPLRALRINGEGTLRLLDAAAKENVGRFVYFSSFHVYGLNAKGLITEGTVPEPVHPYAITHRVAEDYIRMSVKNNKIDGIALRLSNEFGYPSHPEVDRWSLAFNNFCLQAVLTGSIVLKTEGRAHRDFITVTDVSRCVEHILANEKAFTAGGIIYNLGGRCSFSIRDAAERVAGRAERLFGKRPEVVIEKGAPPGGSPETIDYSIDKITSTGFKLLSNVDEEIDKTLSFCTENKEVLRCHLR